MVKTNSMVLELGFQLPNFEMLNANSSKNEYFNSHNLDNRHLLLMFICAHCPFVKYIENQIFTLSKEIENTVQTVAISSNDIFTHPSDSPKNLRLQAQTQGWSFPYLYDENQNFAKKLKAACTPDFYLFDQDLKLAYRGRFDNARPKNDNPVTGKDLMNACQKLSKGAAQETDQIPSLGCNIKWKAENEPNGFLSI